MHASTSTYQLTYSLCYVPVRPLDTTGRTSVTWRKRASVETTGLSNEVGVTLSCSSDWLKHFSCCWHQAGDGKWRSNRSRQAWSSNKRLIDHFMLNCPCSVRRCRRPDWPLRNQSTSVFSCRSWFLRVIITL